MSPTDESVEAAANALLTVNLDAIRTNYRALVARIGRARAAAVVKADAYGLGMAPVARALAGAGCVRFFVADLGEAMALRAELDAVEIYVLDGPVAGAEAPFANHRLVPVLNGLDQIDLWAAFARASGYRPAVIHTDTGMARLGLSATDVAALAGAPRRLAEIEIVYVMSHLACAEIADHPMNRAQLDAFAALRRRLPPAPASLANSSGVFLGSEYHFDLVRLGAALHGLAPVAEAPNPMAQVLELKGKILQLRDVDTPQTVGYGASHRVTGPSRIATVAIGYADGYPRSLGNRGSVYCGDTRVPVVGRISMDLITVDVTGLAEAEIRPGAFVELIGPHHSPDALAAEAGTIGYEILTRIGRRVARRYIGGGEAA